MPGPVAARKRAVTAQGHGAVKTAPYKAPVNARLPDAPRMFPLLQASREG